MLFFLIFFHEQKHYVFEYFEAAGRRSAGVFPLRTRTNPLTALGVRLGLGYLRLTPAL